MADQKAEHLIVLVKIRISPKIFKDVYSEYNQCILAWLLLAYFASLTKNSGSCPENDLCQLFVISDSIKWKDYLQPLL